MKRQKLQIRIKPKKERKTWAINPKTRVHDDESYNRNKEKQSLRKIIKEEE